MEKILVIYGSYLPGYKAGGPIRSLANLVEWMGDEFLFQIITSNHDFNTRQPYPGITTGVWYVVGKCKVMYLAPSQMSLGGWRKILDQVDYELLYLNSFFSVQTRRILTLRRLSLIPDIDIVLAPRGEFSPGALGLKQLKKNLYISIAMKFGLYNKLVWQATNEHEKEDILQVLGRFIPDPPMRIKIAPNLPPKSANAPSQNSTRIKQVGKIRIVFLSRINPKKNLNFSLQLLKGMRGEVIFNIYGFMEDLAYWQKCQKTLECLGSNVRVSYQGELPPDKVLQVLAQYHLLFLPTLGENYGHVILEAFLAGCPVLISDQTPWRDLKLKGIGYDLPLNRPDDFRESLRFFINMDNNEFTQWSQQARLFGKEFIQEQVKSGLEQYRKLFSHEYIQSKGE